MAAKPEHPAHIKTSEQALDEEGLLLTKMRQISK